MVSLLPIQRVRGFPLGALEDVRSEFDRLFAGMERDGASTLAGASTGWVPPMDIVESDEEIRCTIEVPGIARDDLDISVQGNLLRVAGTKKSERTESNGSAYRVFERRYGRFERQLRLPERIDAGRITAQHDNGVLTLVLPKAEEAKPRQIRIEAGADIKRVDAGSAG